jgi:hypothetical protein
MIKVHCGGLFRHIFQELLNIEQFCQRKFNKSKQKIIGKICWALINLTHFWLNLGSRLIEFWGNPGFMG